MKYDLTLRKIKNTGFASLYNKFITRQNLSRNEYGTILSIAICFINAENVSVQQLGYRIIVEYCNQTKDYAPLYEIAINKGLYPVSKFIEQNYLNDNRKTFFTEWNDAFTEQYISGNICQSEQQHSLTTFFSDAKDRTVSVIAPTSYGKSELITSVVQEFAGKKICILTSTKALLMQTKKRIQGVSKGLFSKIIVHPEMYDPTDTSCLAVLTQERLLRLFKKDPMLSFDCLVVDEAHEILDKGARSRNLANVIIVAQKRNPDVIFKFLTPFLKDPSTLKARYTSYDIDSFKVSEYIKSEKYYLYDLRDHTGLQFYDQFLNSFIPVRSPDSFESEEEVVKEYSADKNIVYLNKPTDIEKFAIALARVLPDAESDLITTACDNISSYLRPQYNLLTCLRKGIIYHHGSVPDAIRMYIEELYKKDKSIKYVITSSTLLAGVNLPAERMFILDNRRGRSNLSYDAFKNLVGRVCRFSEIFDSDDGTLDRLEPHIFVVFGKFFSRKSNCKKFLSDMAKVEINFKDDVKNVLLQETPIDSENKEDLRQAAEFIENYENGIIDDYTERYTKTRAGQSCIMNGITEFDVFAHETEMQATAEKCWEQDFKIENTQTLLDMIQELFLKYLPENGSERLKRLDKEDARKFYSMMLDWRIENKSYAEMIGLFVGHWRKILRENRNAIVYVGKWGDIAPPNGKLPHYTKLANKNRAQIVNLAIVRIKEEQDFIDNMLIKYVEALRDLELIDEKFYSQIKYGTDDERIICLLKNGLSLSAALLLIKKYGNYLHIHIPSSTVIYDQSLLSAMKQANENEILIYEVSSCM